MINASFWKKIAEKWSTESDGIVIPDDFTKDIDRVKGIPEKDLEFMNDI